MWSGSWWVNLRRSMNVSTSYLNGEECWWYVVEHSHWWNLSSTLSSLCGWFIVCYTMFLFHWSLVTYVHINGLSSSIDVVLQPQWVCISICLNSLPNRVALSSSVLIHQAMRSLEPCVIHTSKSVPLMWAFSVVIILERGSSIVRACIWTLCFDCAPLMQRRRRLLYYLLWYYCKADPKGCVHVAWGCSQVRSCSMIPHYLTTACCVLCYDVNLNTFKTSSLGNGLNFFLDKWC